MKVLMGLRVLRRQYTITSFADINCITNSGGPEIGRVHGKSHRGIRTPPISKTHTRTKRIPEREREKPDNLGRRVFHVVPNSGDIQISILRDRLGNDLLHQLLRAFGKNARVLMLKDLFW